VLFAIFNSDGSVNYYRKLQDQFVESLIAEAGGAQQPGARHVDALADAERGSINQVFYKEKPKAAEGLAD
jgi:hypothetical protein